MRLVIPKKNFFKILFACFVLIAACTKIVTTDIGSGLIPPVDGVTTKDTILEVVTKNVGEDTIRVGLYDDHVLGYTDDPLFGKTTADVNFQLYPPYFPYYFDTTAENRTLDSVVLVLSYRGVWGDSNKTIGVRVFEISNELQIFNKDSLYTNLTTLNTGLELTENNTPKIVDITNLNDTVRGLYNEAATNQLRIKLNNSFGEILLNQYDSSLVYHDDTLFRAALNGLQIKSEQMGNALLRINLTDTNTKLAIYYKYKNTAGGLDTTVRYFRTNPYYSASSNHIVRVRQNAEVAKYFPSTNEQDSLLFLQTGPGVYTSVKIPGLSTFQNAIIHRAELLMEQVPDNTSDFDTIFTPPNLFLAAKSDDSSKRFAIPNDIIFSNGTIANLYSFGVFPKAKTNIAGKKYYTYNFDISRYVQGIVTRKEPVYTLQLYAPFNNYIYISETSPYSYPISIPSLNYPAIGRVRLKGGGDIKSANRMRLHIVYSLL